MQIGCAWPTSSPHLSPKTTLEKCVLRSLVKEYYHFKKHLRYNISDINPNSNRPIWSSKTMYIERYLRHWPAQTRWCIGSVLRLEISPKIRSFTFPSQRGVDCTDVIDPHETRLIINWNTCYIRSLPLFPRRIPRTASKNGSVSTTRVLLCLRYWYHLWRDHRRGQAPRSRREIPDDIRRKPTERVWFYRRYFLRYYLSNSAPDSTTDPHTMDNMSKYPAMLFESLNAKL